MDSSLQASPVESTELLSTNQLKSAWLRGEPVEFGDPALARTPFPYRETYFPLGFPLTVSTNTPEVLDAAAELWGDFSRLFDTEPLQINVGVTAADSILCPPTPVCRLRDHLSVNFADGENYLINDHGLGYSLAWVTTAALRHRDYFRYFFLDSAAACSVSRSDLPFDHGGNQGGRSSQSRF